MMVGDTVTAVNGAPIRQWYDFLSAVRGQAGVPLVLTVSRQGRRVEIPVTPEEDTEVLPDGTRRAVGRIGVGVALDYTTEPYTLGQAILAGGSRTLLSSTAIVGVVRGLLTGQVDRKAVGGPILIAQQAAQSARLGPYVFLEFLAFVSVNLAVLNMLPIPVLDGGQFLFLLAEGIFRRPLSLRLREQLTMVGLILIVLLMVLAFSNDIRRLIGG
jgi:regulator of sigma E protease